MFLGPISIALRPVIFDPDIWWHLRTGDWILQHHAVPRMDPFSLAGAQHPWIAYSWLFEICASKLYAHFGPSSLLAFAECIIAAIILQLFMLLRSFHVRLARIVVIVLCATIATAPILYLRPWLFTIWFFILELYLVFRRDAEPRKALIILPAVYVLWANLHIQFTYGLALLGLFLVEAAVLRSKKWRGALSFPQWTLKDRGLLLLLCGLATLVNPYGYRIYQVFIEYATQSRVLQYILELRPLTLENLPSALILVFAAAGIWSVGYYRERRPFILLFLAGALFSGLHMKRDAWLLVTVSTFTMAAVSPASGSAAQEERITLRSAVAAFVITILVIAGLSRIKHIDNQHLTASVKQTFPVDAVDFIERQHLSGPIFSTLTWGGYLIWRIPSLPVSIDGRTNLYGPDKIAEHVATIDGLPTWTQDAALRTARLVVVPGGQAIVSVLKLDPCYQLAYSDKVSAVFTTREGCSQGHDGDRKSGVALLNDEHR